MEVRRCDRVAFGADGCVQLFDEFLCCDYVWSATTCFLMHPASVAILSVVDVYNSNTGAWSTAQLSVARSFFAAASVGHLALFGGGYITASCAFRENMVSSADACHFVSSVHIALLFSLRAFAFSCALLQISHPVL